MLREKQVPVNDYVSHELSMLKLLNKVIPLINNGTELGKSVQEDILELKSNMPLIDAEYYLDKEAIPYP